MKYYLGVDIGTTSVKAVAFSPEGEMLKGQSVSYVLRHPMPDRSEQDPDEILRAVVYCIGEVVGALEPFFPDMVSFSAAMHSLLAVDERGCPLTPSIIWADNRAAAVAGMLRGSKEGGAFYRATGVPVHSMTPLCKLLWLRQEAPALFLSARRFIGIKEYVFSKLLGEYLVDSAVAGTSGAVRMIGHQAEVDAEMRIFCYHVKDDAYVKGGATNNGAIVLQWLKESLLNTEESYDQLMALAGTVPPGSDGLLFIPYILGERAPVWNPTARGIYFGLDIRHGKAHLVRAAMEGVIYGLYNTGKILSAGKVIREVHATGGFARSPLWLQMLADVFMVRVLAFGDEEGSAMGAVIMGLEALGGSSAFCRRVPAVYEPDAAAHGVYRERVERFGRIYDKVVMEF